MVQQFLFDDRPHSRQRRIAEREPGQSPERRFGAYIKPLAVDLVA